MLPLRRLSRRQSVLPARLPIEGRRDQMLQRHAAEHALERPTRGGMADRQDPPAIVVLSYISQESFDPFDHLPVALTPGYGSSM